MANNKTYPFLNLGTINAMYLDEIKDALTRVAASGRYVGGPEVENMERHLAEIHNTPYAIGVSSGLDALRLGLRALLTTGRIRPGDEVIVPSNTYIASVLAITDAGLNPVLVDPDPNTYNLTGEGVKRALTHRTRAVMPVHLYGRTCWDETLRQTCIDHNLYVVEDNAQAIGARSTVPGLFDTHMTGSLGHIGCFSFYPTKNIGAMGEAGAILTHDAELADVMRALRNYGSIKQYQNLYEGFNCRLDPMQAAVIDLKLTHLEEESQYRRTLANIYRLEITNPEVVLSAADNNPESNVYHQFVVRVKDREAFRQYMLSHGVETAVHYPTAIHHQPCYSQRMSHLHLPVAEQIAAEVVSLPITRCTTETDAHDIAQIINGYRGL